MENPNTCTHSDAPIRKHESNGTRRFRRQCLACGAGVGNWIPLKKAGVGPWELWDHELQQAGAQEITDSFRRKYEQENSDRTDAFWQEYNVYLLSEKWGLKRRRVLERDNEKCQACLSRKAVQVYHLNYNHLYDEPLFDLIAVCKACHDKITIMDRTRRGQVAVANV